MVWPGRRGFEEGRHGRNLIPSLGKLLLLLLLQVLLLLLLLLQAVVQAEAGTEIHSSVVAGRC